MLAGGQAGDDESRAYLAEHHRRLTAPLAGVLEEHGTTNPSLVADLIDGILGRAIAQVDAGTPSELVTETTLTLFRHALDFDHARPRPRRQP